MQTVSPLIEDWPAEQLLHNPPDTEVLPALQFVQLLDPTTEDLPAEQFEQLKSPEFAN